MTPYTCNNPDFVNIQAPMRVKPLVNPMLPVMLLREGLTVPLVHCFRYETLMKVTC